MAENGRKPEARAARSVGRSAQAGMLIASAAAAKSFERTLMPRNTGDQGIVTGLSVALTYATTAMFQDIIENAAAFVVKREGDVPDDALRRATMLADLMAIGGGIVLNRKLAQQENESLGRAAMRSSGYVMTMAGISGFSVGFVQDLLDIVDPRPNRVSSNRTLGVALVGGGLMALIAEYRRRRSERAAADEEALDLRSMDWNVQAWKSLLMGGAVTAGLGAIAASERVLGMATGRALERGLSGSARFWRMAGHVAALGALGSLAYAGLDRVYQDIEAGTGKIEPAFNKLPESPFVSGSAQSLVPWRTMGREGRRHVLTVLPRAAISEVMGTEAVADPIRVFVGLESARSELDRIAMAIAELERTGAFDRQLLVAVSPTGTGYVNYVTIECCEYFTLGNCATVTLQYSKRPSPLSMDRVWEGRKQFRMLLAAIRRELYKRDPAHRPRLVVFGESLGAHTSQDAFLNEGTQGLEDAGVERALWIGSPHLSKWKSQVLGGQRGDVNPALLIDVDSFEEIEQLSPEAREKLRYVMITHHNDGVGLFGADLVIQKPAWLGEPELRSPAVPRWMRWVPIITAIHTAIDMKNAMNVVPGEFVADGHDYRADLARFVREVYDLPCSDAQLERVEAALRKYEVLRQQMTEAEQQQSAVREIRSETTKATA
ncbi:MAG TPA: alpha/beta-hydrolase family protein [Dehalococcoidia bacterium]|nr:alpha/beta-hydrolase family protein [Dehalococcoidia bacterium]